MAVFIHFQFKEVPFDQKVLPSPKEREDAEGRWVRTHAAFEKFLTIGKNEYTTINSLNKYPYTK